MLTSSTSQYLQPDYIQPLSSMLDVNNSPLALLAQTCSSIGKDPTPTKSSSNLATTSEKKSISSQSSSHNNGNRAKSESPSNNNNVNTNRKNGSDERSKSKPSGGGSGGNDKKDSSSHRSGSKATPPKTGFRVPQPPSKDMNMSDGDRLSQENSRSPSDSGHSSSSSRQNPATSSGGGGSRGHGSSSSSSIGGKQMGGGGGGGGGNSCSSMLLELNQEAMNKNAIISHPSSSFLHGSSSIHPLYSSFKLHDSLQALHAGAGLVAPSLQGISPSACSLPFLGYPLSIDPLAAYSASLAAHCNGLAGLSSSSQKSPVTGISTPVCNSAMLSPYVSYARVKTAAGATTLVPVCKDPFCAHCQLTMHGAQLSATTAGASCTGPGCSQCNQHDKALISSSGSLTSPSSIHQAVTHTGLPPFYPGALSSLCSHAAFNAAALQNPHGGPGGGPLVTAPCVCNWVQGSEYCGKRFTSSDELLQHLRSHTSSADAFVSPFNAAAAAAAAGGLPLSALGFPLNSLLGCPSQLPGITSLSPGGLLTSYPRSFSPNTLLAAARYHPYKPPSLSAVISGSSGSQVLPSAFPSLAAYYSPYAFYGQRAGAAAAAGP